MTESEVSVRFSRFWRGLPEDDNFFTRAISEALGQVRVRHVPDSRAHVDVEVTSVFKSRREILRDRVRSFSAKGGDLGPAALRNTSASHEPSSRATVNIWYTGENIRPPADGWDLSLSYDRDSLGGFNRYLPLWWMQLDWWGPSVGHRLGAAVTQDVLHSSRDIARRPKFACAFVGNPDPMRSHVIRALGEVGQVDVFGRAVGRPVPNKLNIASEYRFNICLENDLYPGYVTEKPMEAWWCGNIPIYWGDDAGGFINPECMLNLARSEDVAELVEAVRLVDESESLFTEMASSAFLSRAVDLENVLDGLRKTIA